MDSYQFDTGNLTFDGINDANSESLPSEHVPLVNRNGATGAEISADSVSVPSDSDGVYVEHYVRLQLVDNDILRYLHCSCGKKRKAVEVITAYLLNHSHQGESWFCQVFCGFSVTSDASSSNHITGQSNVMSHSTGIREIATCTHSVNSANAGSGENTVDSLAAYTQTIIPESEDEQEVDEDAELNLTVENEESEDQEEDEDAEQNLTVENEGSDGEQEEVEEDDEPNGLAVEDEAKMELLEYIRTIKAGLKVQAFYLCIKLHKYESAKSTCTESKVHCCICLEDYSDEEELGKIDCGHMYHVDCIKEWVMRENTCPMCKREALARLPCFV